MNAKVNNPAKVRVSVNGMRDYLINTWGGDVLQGNEALQTYVDDFFKKDFNEEEILKRMRDGDMLLVFAKNIDRRNKRVIFPEEATTSKVKLHILSVDSGIVVLVLAANRFIENNIEFINAELVGNETFIRSRKFPKRYIPAWMGVRTAEKIICVDEIIRFLNDENLRKAYYNYNQHFSRDDFELWRKQYNVKFSMSRRRQAIISDIIKMIINKTR